MNTSESRDRSTLRVAVTGAARGIGRATAEMCVRQGMSVAIGSPHGQTCAAIAAELGESAVGIALDVRDAESFEGFLDTAEDRLGQIDVLVNNAGVAVFGDFAEEHPGDTDRMLDVNLGGVITGTRLALKRFLPRGHGHIINVASSSGQIATAGAATYAATKHAVVGFSRALRAELRGSGVQLTLVMPGLVQTDMIDGLTKPWATRIVEPNDVAAQILRSFRNRREELFVPRELGVLARLVAGTPPTTADLLKRLVGADSVMGDAHGRRPRSLH